MIRPLQFMPVYAAIKEEPQVVRAELPCLTQNYGFLEASERFRIMSNISIFFGVVRVPCAVCRVSVVLRL